MRLLLLGVRGSTPAPGPEFIRYGGDTTCIAVVAEGDTDASLVLDAGTGLRALTARMSVPAFRGAIMLSHLHWDHVQGLPFFAAGDRPSSEVDLYLPAQLGESGRQLLSRMMSPPLFPIEPDGLHGSWSFTALESGARRIGAFEVTAFDVAHKGGRTFGYRVEDAAGSMAYLPDHAPGRGVSDEARALIAGVDVLVHDAQYLESERADADAYAHATVDQAIELAAAAEVGALVLFHHAPSRTDDELDELAKSLVASMQVTVARQNLAIDVG